MESLQASRGIEDDSEMTRKWRCQSRWALLRINLCTESVYFIFGRML